MRTKSIKRGITVQVLVQLLLVHPCVGTYLHDSGTWGLETVYTVIFCKLRKKKEMNLNIVFLFSLSGEKQLLWKYCSTLFSLQNRTNPYFFQSCCIPRLGLKAEPAVKPRAELWTSPVAPTCQMDLIPWLESRISG